MNLIVTCSDIKYSSFILEHWYCSLKSCSSLKDTKVVLIDYGVDASHRKALEKHGVHMIEGTKKNNITIERHNDLCRYLDRTEYDQVMMVDGGDIIFQKDPTVLFEKHKSDFRFVCEETNVPFDDFFMSSFSESDANKIRSFLHGRKMINVGVIIGPAHKFSKLSKACYELIEDRSKFGPEQVALNYLLYKQKYTVLHHKYNFIVTTMPEPFNIKKGVFYFRNGHKIPIVHNAGRFDFWRPIKNFGFGSDRNQVKPLTYYAIKFFYALVNLFTKR